MVQINRAVNKAVKRKHWVDEARRLKGEGFECQCGSHKLRATRKGVECRKCGRYVLKEEGIAQKPDVKAGEEIRQKPSLFRKYLGWG